MIYFFEDLQYAIKWDFFEDFHPLWMSITKLAQHKKYSHKYLWMLRVRVMTYFCSTFLQEKFTNSPWISYVKYKTVLIQKETYREDMWVFPKLSDHWWYACRTCKNSLCQNLLLLADSQCCENHKKVSFLSQFRSSRKYKIDHNQ